MLPEFRPVGVLRAGTVTPNLQSFFDMGPDAHRFRRLLISGNWSYWCVIFRGLHHCVYSHSLEFTKHGRTFCSDVIRKIIKLFGIHANMYKYGGVNSPADVPKCLPKMRFITEPHAI